MTLEHIQIIFHELWDELDAEEFKAFIFMLCSASLNRNSGVFRYNDRVHDRKSGISKNVFSRAIKKLKQLQVVEVRVQHGCYADVTSCLTTEQDKTEQDKTEQNTIAQSPVGSCASVFDFNSLYEKYPRKIGKSRGMQLCKQRIKSQADFDLLSKAVDNYARYCVEKKTEQQYIKHFSSFMSSWRDWIEPQIDQTKVIENNWDYIFGEGEK